MRVSYGRIRADVGSTTPSGIAIFQFRDSQGVLISEASVPAAELVQEGRIFAEVNGPVNTGLAIANPNEAPAIISFYFTDTSGASFSNGSFELEAHQQTAKLLHQPPFNAGRMVLGTFTFTSSAPVAVTALRVFTNEAGEFLMTTLPVAPLAAASQETVYFPHFAAGGGWVSQVILVNSLDSMITGTVRFLGSGSDTTAGSPVILTLDDGSTGSNFDYSIPPRSSQRFTTSNAFGALNAGSVRATPSNGNAAPSGLVVFSYAQDEKTVAEAGVPVSPKGSAFRAYVETSGTPGQVGSIRSGLAIANVANTSNTVTLEVTNLDGSPADAPTQLSLPPSGQIARLLDEILSLPDNFSGVLRATSTDDAAIAVLRFRVNEKSDLKVTTLSPSNEMGPATSEDRFFAHLADSGGWSTQFILFSGTAGQASSGTLSFVDALGEPLGLTPQRGGSTQKIAAIVPAAPSFGPTEAGKQAQDLFAVTVNDNSGMPVSDATYRWDTDENAGWVYPPEGATGTDGRISAVWVAGLPGAGSMTLTVQNAVSVLTAEIATESIVSRRPPSSSINLSMPSGASSGYSIDLTPLTEPAGTYYAAIQWDGGYTGLQRAGSRYDRQLQFSVWDAEGIDARVIQRGERVICSPFGGEGTGQKCELNYPWRVGDTYRFEVTEEDLNGGSVMTLHVTDLASNRRTFVGALRYGRRADLSWMNMFVEGFTHTAPTCLAQPVRSAAIRRAMARAADGSWQPVTRGVLSPHREDAGNPGTPACANLTARDHATGLEVVMGGLTAGGPLTRREVTIPREEPPPGQL